MLNPDLQELYQEVILDHNKRPRNFRVIENRTHFAKGYNPLCGDQVEISLILDENNVVTDVAFQGEGCAISTASSSLMTEAVKGKTVTEVEALFAAFHTAVTDEATDIDALGRLRILIGVRKYPARVKCATLPWHALNAALHKHQEPVKTE